MGNRLWPRLRIRAHNKGQHLAALVGKTLEFRADAGARLLGPHGAVLRCWRCGREQELTAEQAAGYLGAGWPKCHKRTMALVSRLTSGNT